MDCVQVLIVGRGSESPLGITGTVTLVQIDGLNVLIDVGDPWNGQEIRDGLLKYSLNCDDITHVVITHGHLDHCANLSFFKNAKILMDSDIAIKVNGQIEYSSVENWPYELSKNIQIHKLSGHTHSDLLVEVIRKDQKIVMICGDLIESETSKGIEYAVDPEKLAESQSFIFSRANFIVPDAAMNEPGIQSSCSICVAPLRSSQKISALKCGHTYHYSCVSQWLNVKTECPNCRKKLRKTDIIEKLFFDVRVNDDGESSKEIDFAEKADKLAEELSKEKEALAEKEKLCTNLQANVKALEKKVLREKERYSKDIPALKQRNQHLEMVASETEHAKKDLALCKSQLRACEFYKILQYKNGSDENTEKSLSRYLKADYKIDTEKFFELMKSQNKELAAKRTEAIREAEKLRGETQNLRKENKDQSNIIKALQKEIQQLRDVANIQTPINKKLRSIIDAETPADQKRKSMGFDMSNSLLERDSSYFDQENKKYEDLDFIPKPSTSTENKKGKSALAFLEEQEKDDPIFKKVTEKLDNVEIAALNDSIDDADFSDIKIPSTILKRLPVIPKKKNLNIVPKPCFDDTLSPEVIKPKQIKRAFSQNDVKEPKAKKPAVNSHRLSSFYPRVSSNNVECVTID
ncbi:unnamed protein product [Caenorhabditis angaria]|uniref:RING-type domain-containing protein n=1 Tax=Caenorhabditis angaria TaxID=860376 RepID=A0A9P1IDX5_9PELO|nr:unnamed protein product [Caenorhabditis angaria]